MLPSLKSHWLKPPCQQILLVEIPTKNNLTGSNYRAKKSDWLIRPLPEIPLVGTAMSKNPIGRNSRPKITLLGQTIGKINLIGWCALLLKSHLLKPQCQKTVLVEIPIKNNPTGPNYGRKKSDWLILPPSPPKSCWLKPQCQKSLLVEISAKNNLIGSNHWLKKSDWLICSPPWNPIGWNCNVNNPIGRNPDQK